MKVLVLGVGLVGRALAQRLVAEGHHVVGTTTTPAKVDDLATACSEVVVLRGSDASAVAAAAEGCDAIAVCAGPSAAHAMTVEEREKSYEEILVGTARSVTVAPGDPHLVMLSSLSVYGDAANHLDVIAEDSPLTDSADPSPANFRAAEDVYLATGRATVLRCADIFGGDDPPLAVKVEGAHTYMGGSVPFGADPLFYRVHVDDVVAAVHHAVTHRLIGPFNLTHPGVPARNGELFDAVSERLGKPPLEYRNEILAPTKPISVDRLLATGFTLSATEPTTLDSVDA